MEVPAPTVTELNAPYWQGLEEGSLQFQRCEQCAHAWLPSREECPACLSDRWRWEPAQGGGHLVSWVVYHHAFHESLSDRLPYNVAIVELDEGPRLITNITDGAGDLEIGCQVTLVIEREGATAVARFRLT